MGFAVEFEPEQIDRAEQGSQPTPGWCEIRLADVFTDDDGNVNLEFRVAGGVNDGRKITDKVFDPDGAPDGEKRRKGLDRIIGLATRLGLVKRGVGGTFDGDFTQAIGWTGYGHLTERKYKRQDGSDGVSVDLGWLGIYPRMYEDQTPADIKRRRKYPKDFPEAWRKANTVPGAVGSVGTGNAALDELAARGTDQATAAAAVAAREPSLSDKFAAMGL